MVELKDLALQQANQGKTTLPVSLGAGVGIRVGLQNLFNDNSDEAKLLAFQLQLLKSHLGNNFQSAV